MTTTNYGLQFTENPRIRTYYCTKHSTIQRHTKPPPSKHWPDEHNLFVTHLTLYVTKTTTYNACFTKTAVTNLILWNSTLKKTTNLTKPTTRDVPDPDTSIRYPVRFRYPVASGKILPDIYQIIIFLIIFFNFWDNGEKTLEREFKSYLTGLTSRAFICRLPNLFQFYLDQWKHVLFKFQL